MRMKKAQRQSQPEDQRCEENQLAQSGFPVTPAEVEVKAGAGELADGEESVQARVDQEKFPPARQAVWPGSLEPAQIHGEAEGEENERVSPVAALLGIGAGGLPQQPGDGYGQRSVQSAPFP